MRDNFSCFPVQFEHDLNKIDQSNRPVFNWLSCTTRKKDSLHIGSTRIKFKTELDTLGHEVVLKVGEHFADHLPVDLNHTVFNEIDCNVDIVFVNGHLKGQLIQFESIIRVIVCESQVASLVLENYLHVWRGKLHVVCLLQNDLVHMLIVVAHAIVQIQKCLVWIFFELER